MSRFLFHIVRDILYGIISNVTFLMSDGALLGSAACKRKEYSSLYDKQ